MRTLYPPMTLIVALPMLLAGCAGMPGSEPVHVTVAGIEQLPGEGLEARMLVKLRVQNPNDTPIDYDGVYVELAVLNKTYATGVSDGRGSIPRFGEALVEVPVTISALRVGLNALGYAMSGKLPEQISYKMSGKLNVSMFGSVHFQADGEFALPRAGADQ